MDARTPSTVTETACESPRERSFTVTEFHRMGEVGVLGAGERVELLEGRIVEMSPIGPRHSALLRRMARVFYAQIGQRALVAVQDPVKLGEYSEPQPDLCLLKPRRDEYATAHPTAKDILLLVEVADTSVDIDRRKADLYARAGVREYWIVNLAARAVEVHRRPTAAGYRARQDVAEGGTVSVSALRGVQVAVKDIFGR